VSSARTISHPSREIATLSSCPVAYHLVTGKIVEAHYKPVNGQIP
jgi:hypothetical protein